MGEGERLQVGDASDSKFNQMYMANTQNISFIYKNLLN